MREHGMCGAKTTHHTVQGVVRPGAPEGLSAEVSYNPDGRLAEQPWGLKVTLH